MTNQDNFLKELPKDTIRLLGSCQVITSIYSVIKELVENSLDAFANSIEIKLTNYGLDRIEVRDNGSGIKVKDVPYIAKKYYTSKIQSYKDLDFLDTYGFRGEALGSLCSICSLSVTTRTKEDDLSLTYTFNAAGDIISSKPSHLTQGTTITVSNLFKNLPVRKQIYNSIAKKKEDIQKIEKLLVSYAFAHPELRLILRHNKDIIWQKNTCTDRKTAVLGIVGKQLFETLEYHRMENEDPAVKFEAYLPRIKGDFHISSRSNNEKCHFLVNKRPVNFKDLEKMLKKYYSASCVDGSERYPTCFVSMELPQTEIDVNLEPNKHRVLMHHKESVLKMLEQLLENIYGSLDTKYHKNHTHHDQEEKLKEAENSVISEEGASTGQKLIIPVNNDNLDNLPVFNESILKKCDDAASEFQTTKDKTTIDRDPSLPKTHDERNIDIGHSEIITQNCSDDSLFDMPLEDCDSDSLLNCILGDDTLDSTGLCKNTNIVCDPNLKTNSETTTSAQSINVNIGNTNQEVTSTCKKPELLSSLEVEKSNHFDEESNAWGEKRETALNNCNLTGSGSPSWSKGNLLAGKEGHAVQPVTLLANPLKRPATPPLMTPPSKRRILQPMVLMFAISLSFLMIISGLISNENQVDLPSLIKESPVMIKHTDTAFSVFCKENRSKVVEENPDADFSTISEILKQQWSTISPEEKSKFITFSTKIQQQPNSGEMVKKISKPVACAIGKQMKVASKKPLSVKDQLKAATNRCNTIHPKKDKVLPFSIEKLRKSLGCRTLGSEVVEERKLINCLKGCGAWLSYNKGHIEVINHLRIQETVIFHQLMSDHKLPSNNIDVPIKLSSRNIGGDAHWTTLVSLCHCSKTLSSSAFIEDPRISYNGFRIKYYLGKEGEPNDLELVGQPDYISMYGCEDLAEILELIGRTNASDVNKSRPLKVINYIKGEAVRMSRKLPRYFGKQDLEELFFQQQSILPVGCEHCLHNKPFFINLYSMEDVPLTQTQDKSTMID